MKVIFSILLVIMASCSNQNDGDIDLKNNRQTWKLVKMTSSWQNSETTGADMPWQETIQLINGIFEKVRVENGKTSKISGRYEFSEESDGRYLILIFNEPNPIIGNCTGDLNEYYRIQSDKVLQGSWMACDGPGLEYQLIN